MTARRCPYCKTLANQSAQWGNARPERISGTVFYQARIAATCNNCHNVNIAVVTHPEANINYTNPQPDLVRILEKLADNLTWYPVSVDSPDYPDVPAHVAECAKQAHQAAGIGAYIASILMARTTIEATAKAKDIKTGDLVKKIEAMSDQGLIRPTLKDAAHAIRYVGNDMAHGDVEDAPDKQDAEDILTLMDLVLVEVFQATALTEQILARRRPGKNPI